MELKMEERPLGRPSWAVSVSDIVVSSVGLTRQINWVWKGKGANGIAERSPGVWTVEANSNAVALALWLNLLGGKTRLTVEKLVFHFEREVLPDLFWQRLRFVDCSFAGNRVSKWEMINCLFDECCLYDVIVKNAQWRYVDFDGGKWECVYLKGMDWMQVGLTGVEFAQIALQNGTINRGSWTLCEFYETTLEKLKLHYVRFNLDLCRITFKDVCGQTEKFGLVKLRYIGSCYRKLDGYWFHAFWNEEGEERGFYGFAGCRRFSEAEWRKHASKYVDEPWDDFTLEQLEYKKKWVLGWLDWYAKKPEILNETPPD